MRPIPRFGYLGGGLLTSAGALGLAVTGLSEPLTPHGQHLLLFEVNPAQNVLHLVIGLVMVAGAAASDAAARTTALVASAALGTLGLVGLAMMGPAGNALALDAWSTVAHLGLAAWGTTATLRDTGHRGAPADSTAVRHP